MYCLYAAQSLYSCLYAPHQRNRAVLLLVVKEERTVRKPADKMILTLHSLCRRSSSILTR